MDINIRKAVKDNFKNSNPEDILKAITDATSTNEEKVLPGLGVLFEELWKASDDNFKNRIVDTLAKQL